MVQLLNVNAPTIHHRSRQYEAGDKIRYSFEAGLPVELLVFQLSLGDSRLVCRGCELDRSKSLEQQGCQTKDTIYCLEVAPEDACPEWARVGRCAQGSKCTASHTHTMKLSPRYVEHRAATMSAESSPPTSPPASPPADLGVVCRNWAAHGSCHYGDQCFYAHTHTEDEAEDSQSSSWEQDSQWEPAEEQWQGDKQWGWAEAGTAHHEWNNWNQQSAGTQMIPAMGHMAQYHQPGMAAMGVVGGAWGAWGSQQLEWAPVY